ncbi:putative histone deacetylase [Trypanosoma rangeli]|uniref:histone deacetylase n=1 Tax=Trypanosoma rangeli TaxID=5698 RepID=A0A422NJU7_TRYRA|nr:putative histone deacetylase [Trypanosoma rangeli]RNF05746.1 putative histone deacetylase [Trypanosoma rangeli]|eukprot:RNF05746.1 putative histone deacetylase [Trypanosoma rangeli]
MQGFGARLDGEVTVRRFVAPQRSTTATIRSGDLLEPIAAVAARVGVDAARLEGLVDAQGLAIFGKLQAGAEVFLAGAVVENDANDGNNDDGGTERSLLQPPDASVAWAYDPRMLLHVPPVDRIPETPYRLQRAVECLKSTPRANELLPEELLFPEEEEAATTPRARLDDANKTSTSEVVPPSCWLPPRLATLEEIALCHDTSRYRGFVEHGTALTPLLKTDVYCNDMTSSVATRLAVGAVIDAARCALAGTPSFAFCLVRPPGHHCTVDTPGGFCLANNVAIAARQLLKDWRDDNKGRGDGTLSASPRIAIVDLDVHHGEGTQSFVEEEPPPLCDANTVSPLLYFSLHRYDHGTFYPADPRGDTAYVGRYRNVCNVAVNTAANDPACCEEVVSDAVFERVVDDVLLPRLCRFCPDVVLLSLGFDAAYGDPLGRMAVEGGFAYAVRALKQFCRSQPQQRKVRELHAGLVVVLEGGYLPVAVAQGVTAVAHALRYPANDADVVRYAARQVPKTWQDLRRRTARQQHEIKQQQVEEQLHGVEGEVKKAEALCETASASPTQSIEGAALLPEDGILLERHERWCDRLISRVLSIHEEANGPQ